MWVTALSVTPTTAGYLRVTSMQRLEQYGLLGLCHLLFTAFLPFPVSFYRLEEKGAAPGEPVATLRAEESSHPE